MIEFITKQVTVLASYSLLLTGLILAIRTPSTQNKWMAIFFIGCVILYLIIEFIPPGIFLYLLIAGPYLIPFSFWLLSRSLFTDDRLPSGQTFAITTGVLVIYYLLKYLIDNEDCNCSGFVSLASRSISLIFVLLAIFEAQKGKNDDLIEKRRKLRSSFTYVVSILVLLTLLAELGLSNSEQEFPKLFQRSAILAFSTFFLIKNITWTDDFLGLPLKKIEIQDPELIDRIHLKMSDDHLYRKEGLTIGQLAESLDEQEYKIRQVINKQIGFRNFTDFTNSHRIQEAKEIFSDPDQKKVTILEVAYKVGFSSIGPFNRAFKLVTGVTPTEFRNF